MADRYGVLILPWLLIGIVSGCAPYRLGSPDTDRPDAAIINPPRGERGNSPFYDVFGQRYYVLASSAGYRENGVASWYGSDFHGEPTSSGETYDMYALTAAHKTLPIPTWVEVKNLRNNTRVIVKVNDRGPFVDDRIIDLSYRAAQDLDMIGPGTAFVEVRTLGTPAAGRISSGVPAATTGSVPDRSRFSVISGAVADTPRPDDRSFEQLYVQVGAFSEQPNAMRLAEQLKGQGFSNSFIVSVGQGRGRLHRVRIGPLSGAEQFDRINSGLRSMGVYDGRLVVER